MSTYTIYELLGTVVRDDGVIVCPAQSIDDANFVAYQVWIAAGNEPTIDNTTNMSVADAQSMICDQINVFRDAFMYDHFSFGGNRWNSDRNSISNLTGVNVLSIQNGGQLPSGFVWRDYDNNNISMTATTMAELGATAAAFVTAVYQNSWTHKANVNALTSYADVVNYNYMTGWPATEIDGVTVVFPTI